MRTLLKHCLGWSLAWLSHLDAGDRCKEWQPASAWGGKGDSPGAIYNSSISQLWTSPMRKLRRSHISLCKAMQEAKVDLGIEFGLSGISCPHNDLSFPLDSISCEEPEEHLTAHGSRHV